MSNPNSIQTNVNLTREDHEKLVAMMDDDGYVTKSPFVRWLIRQEFDRRDILYIRACLCSNSGF